MKYILIAVIFALTGCATSNFQMGSDFNVDNVGLIVKGKTTSVDLVSLFGQPYSKSAISANGEKWVYFHTTSESKATAFITVKVETESNSKTLDVIIIDGVVANYTFTQGATPFSFNAG